MTVAAFYGDEHGNYTRRSVLLLLLKLQGRMCSICGGVMQRHEMTIDHVIPRSRGGVHDFSNWMVAHETCNMMKGSNMPSETEPKSYDDLIYEARKELLYLFEHDNTSAFRILEALAAFVDLKIKQAINGVADHVAEEYDPDKHAVTESEWRIARDIEETIRQYPEIFGE